MLHIEKSTLVLSSFKESTSVYTSMLIISNLIQCYPLTSETSLMTTPFQRFHDVVL